MARKTYKRNNTSLNIYLSSWAAQVGQLISKIVFFLKFCFGSKIFKISGFLLLLRSLIIQISDCKESLKMSEYRSKSDAGKLVTVLVYSDQFWPSVVHPAEEKEGNLILPKIIEKDIEDLKKLFSEYRPSRTLVWDHNYLLKK